MNEATNKALNPSKFRDTFHEDCNPEPPNMSVEVLKIGFAGIRNKDTRTMLEKWFEHYLIELKIDQPLIEYDETNDVVIIELENVEQYQRVLGFIEKNL